MFNAQCGFYLNVNIYQNMYYLQGMEENFCVLPVMKILVDGYFPLNSAMYAEKVQITFMFFLQCGFSSSFTFSILLQLQI